MTRLFHLFIGPGPDRAAGSLADALWAVVSGTSRYIQWGANGLFIAGQTIELHAQAEAHTTVVPLAFGCFTSTQRAEAQASHVRLAATHPQLAAVVAHAGPLPLLCAVMDDDGMRLYHRVHHTVGGVLYLSLTTAPGAQVPASDDGWRHLLEQARPRWAAVQPLLSDDCSYSKWRADIEMERKFTFEGLPDTWQLIRKLHNAICNGALPGFVPELDRDFQVFDYESHIHAVHGPAEEQGYISFIPQADGRMTIKRKWFTQNAEIRRESLFPDQCIEPHHISRRVAELVQAPVQRLPSFRRKRFDVNFESLDTGNVYGIYFDICRTVDQTHHAFSQCEVEYCRSRTFGPLRHVMEEFEQVADFTEQFLSREGVPFERNLYSKLDFALEAAAINGQEPT